MGMSTMASIIDQAQLFRRDAYVCAQLNAQTALGVTGNAAVLAVCANGPRARLVLDYAPSQGMAPGDGTLETDIAGLQAAQTALGTVAQNTQLRQQITSLVNGG